MIKGEFATDYERKIDLILTFMGIEHEVKDGFVYSRNSFNPFADLNDAWEFAEYAQGKGVIKRIYLEKYPNRPTEVVVDYPEYEYYVEDNENPAEALTEAVLKVLEGAEK